MGGIGESSGFQTHEVLNQPTPLADYDLFVSDRALAEATAREGAEWAVPTLSALGLRLGTRHRERDVRGTLTVTPHSSSRTALGS